MAFDTTYSATLTATASDESNSFTATQSTDTVVTDYTSNLTFEVVAGSEISVPLPAINALVSLVVTGTQAVDVSIKNDISFQTVYTGAYSRFYSRYFGTTGTTFDHLKIKCNDTLDSVVTIAFAGNEALPSS